MIKDVIVNLTVGSGRDVAGPFAISVAEAFGAHVAGVAFSYEPIIPPTIMGGVPASFIDEQRADNDKAAKDAATLFETDAKRAGVSSEIRIMTSSVAGASDTFGAMARRFDLSVIAQAEPGKVQPEELIVEGALFGSGRPVVVVPYIDKAPLKVDRVMICWDASRNAARAVADAMPFLKRAKAVDIVIVTSEKPKSDVFPGAVIGAHLSRHDINVDIKRIVASGKDIAGTLLSHAADSAADFIVMGGYGHSRLREFIWGGATRGILGAMTVPVLMSH